MYVLIGIFWKIVKNEFIIVKGIVVINFFLIVVIWCCELNLFVIGINLIFIYCIKLFIC